MDAGAALVNDPLVGSIQNYANVVSIQRLGYNDHGPVHARIVALNCLRHRLLLNFEAEADRVDPDELVRQVVEMTPTQPVGMPVAAKA